MIELTTPLNKEDIIPLQAGDWVTLSGKIFIMRDRTHYRLFEEQVDPPEPLAGYAVLHAAPSYRKIDGKYEILTVGPTTSMRMEKYTPELLTRYGVKAIIGKGGMGDETRKSLQLNSAIYLEYVGGTSALLLDQITEVTHVWWEDLYGEALFEINVLKMGPMLVSMDSHGKDLFKDVSNAAKSKIDKIIEKS
ncbi:MAG: FumA C-terminus/TtdB family hydratase beta subunit [Candidatus Thermoplasmatota archaeon]|nr:FumA C-terminus/TtdB family hydratase beta subunit [Candidatus Thermoplasmatota archaeon]